MASYVYLNLHTADMDAPTEYSFAEYTTESLHGLMNEANEELKRINNLRRSEMACYEDDDIYDEIENWKRQAYAEIERREAAAAAEAAAEASTEEDEADAEDDRWPEEDYALRSTNPKEPSEETVYMKPLTPDQVQKACDILEKKARDAGTPPTLDEYWAMDAAERDNWMCRSCCHPALAGSIIPGAYCSVRCAAQKYS
jgi:hypothetical protein